MKTIFKYIHFELEEEKQKTNVYYCRNNKSNEILGVVKWYGSWRQYSFFPFKNTVFSTGCLNDIISFIKQL
jgi:hypothetical protein